MYRGPWGPEPQRLPPLSFYLLRSQPQPLKQVVGRSRCSLWGVRDQGGGLRSCMCPWAVPLSALELIWALQGCHAWSGEDSKRLSGG